MKDVMIDFETLGKGPNKALCQIGAVFFDRVTGYLGEEFFANIDARSHEVRGGVCDADTVYWWLAQSDEARHALLTPTPRPVTEVMTELNEFLAPATRVWSHATFDFVTLMATLQQLAIPPKVSYRATMDLRTLTTLAGIATTAFPREGIHHNGLDDAKYQVKYCAAALNAVKTNKQALALLSRLCES